MNKQQKNLLLLVLSILFVILLFAVLSKKDPTKNLNSHRPHKRPTTKPMERETNGELGDMTSFNFSCPRNPTFQLDPNKPVPDFFLIGVAKGGTTSFSNYLPSHPNVKSITPKEPNYWTWRYITIEKYQKLFATNEEKAAGIISGEYTTSYILHPLVPRRIYSQLPNAKILMILRNPIDRAYSHYTMSLRAKLEVHPFEQIIAKEFEEIDDLRERARICFRSPTCDVSECFPRNEVHRHDKNQNHFMFNVEHDMKDYYYTSYLFRSIYDDSVERWLSVFPREQILILKSEDMYENNTKIMNEVVDFLGLPYFDFGTQEVMNESWGGGASNKYKDPHSYDPIRNDTRELLVKFFEPYNQRLYSIIGRDLGWK